MYPTHKNDANYASRSLSSGSTFSDSDNCHHDSSEWRMWYSEPNDMPGSFILHLIFLLAWFMLFIISMKLVLIESPFQAASKLWWSRAHGVATTSIRLLLHLLLVIAIARSSNRDTIACMEFSYADKHNGNGLYMFVHGFFYPLLLCSVLSTMKLAVEGYLLEIYNNCKAMDEGKMFRRALTTTTVLQTLFMSKGHMLRVELLTLLVALYQLILFIVSISFEQYHNEHHIGTNRSDNYNHILSILLVSQEVIQCITGIALLFIGFYSWQQDLYISDTLKSKVITHKKDQVFQPRLTLFTIVSVILTGLLITLTSFASSNTIMNQAVSAFLVNNIFTHGIEIILFYRCCYIDQHNLQTFLLNNDDESQLSKKSRQLANMAHSINGSDAVPRPGSYKPRYPIRGVDKDKQEPILVHDRVELTPTAQHPRWVKAWTKHPSNMSDASLPTNSDKVTTSTTTTAVVQHNQNLSTQIFDPNEQYARFYSYYDGNTSTIHNNSSEDTAVNHAYLDIEQYYNIENDLMQHYQPPAMAMTDNPSTNDTINYAFHDV